MKDGCAEEEFAGYDTVKRNVYSIPFVPKATVVKRGERRPKVLVLREEGHNGDSEMRAFFNAGGWDAMDCHMSDLMERRVSLDNFQCLAAVGGFSYKDVFGSAKGQAGVIRFDPYTKEMFDQFYERDDTCSFGICNGFQLFERLGILPFRGLEDIRQPQLIQNRSGQFISKEIRIRVLSNRSIWTEGMEGLIFGVNVDHGEGQQFFPDLSVLDQVIAQKLVPMIYVDEDGNVATKYPYNPNGSINGIAALCSPCRRHFGAMPHFERAFRRITCHYWPKEYDHIKISPYLQMVQNARQWAMEHR